MPMIVVMTVMGRSHDRVDERRDRDDRADDHHLPETRGLIPPEVASHFLAAHQHTRYKLEAND